MNSKVAPVQQQQPGYVAPPASTSQPGHVPQRQWAPAVNSVQGCPPGLEYLTQTDQLSIRQEIELLEAIIGWETNNKYMILNNLGQQMYFAAEDTDVCMRQCCGANRGFVIHILNNNSQEVMRLSREFKCFGGFCCWCASDPCAHEVMVEAPVGQLIGYVRQEYSSWSPNFSLKDASGNPLLNIHGPCCVFRMPCCEDKFSVWTADDTAAIGEICKQRGIQELIVDATNFGANFPMSLDVRTKALLLAAVFLIDFMYFERSGGRSGILA